MDAEQLKQSMSHSPVVITVDPDWESAFVVDNQTFWVNLTVPQKGRAFYCVFNVSPTGQISPSTESKRELTSHNLSVQINKEGRNLLHITLLENNLPLHTQTVQSAFLNSRLNQKGYAQCISYNSSMIATGHSDNGGLFVYDVTDKGFNKPELVRTLQGHLLDVLTVQFFPSGTVILSGGTDMTLKIWTILQGGMCVAELKGHNRGIRSTDMIDRGRNVVSSSADGTVKLWDIPSQSIIHSWSIPHGGTVNQVKVFPYGVEGTEAKDSRDVGTDGKLILLAGENKVLQICDLRQRESIFSYKAESAVNAVSGLPQSHCVIAGEQDGTTTSWDLRNTAAPLSKLILPDTVVTKLLDDHNHCWIGTGSGFTYKWHITQPSSPPVLLLSDTEPITGLLHKNQHEIITLSRKGIIRLYSV